MVIMANLVKRRNVASTGKSILLLVVECPTSYVYSVPAKKSYHGLLYYILLVAANLDAVIRLAQTWMTL